MTATRWTDEMLDKLADSIRENSESIRENSESMKLTDEKLDKVVNSVKELRDESKFLEIRFSAYQQASQWVVNLAFGLLATATLTTIISAVVRR